jgi:hypothetical protein
MKELLLFQYLDSSSKSSDITPKPKLTERAEVTLAYDALCVIAFSPTATIVLDLLKG